MENQKLRQEIKNIEKQIKILEKYQDIIGVKEEVKKIKAKIQPKYEEAETYVRSASLFYTETMEQARRRAENLLKETDEQLSQALDRYKRSKSLCGGKLSRRGI